MPMQPPVTNPAAQPAPQNAMADMQKQYALSQLGQNQASTAAGFRPMPTGTFAGAMGTGSRSDPLLGSNAPAPQPMQTPPQAPDQNQAFMDRMRAMQADQTKSQQRVAGMPQNRPTTLRPMARQPMAPTGQQIAGENAEMQNRLKGGLMNQGDIDKFTAERNQYMNQQRNPYGRA
jgi:hypothetical protein